MPRVIILPQVFPPEIHPTAVMFEELAQDLVQNGWDVTVSVGWPHHPTGELPQGWRKSLFKVSNEGGVDITRTWHITNPSRRMDVRAGVFVSQALAAATGAALSKRADLILVCGPPLIGPNLAALVAKRHRAKLVNVIYDLYPDIAEETGKVTNPLVLRAARLAERMQYRASDMTIVLSDSFRSVLVSRGVPQERVSVVPVWLDGEEIQPKPRENSWRREQGISLEKFVVLYAGTIGLVSGAGVAIDAAALLRHRSDVCFLFVGVGEECPRIQKKSQELRLDNVRFLPFQPREHLSDVQATGDVGLVTLSPGRARTSVPSKVLAYMAAGRPVVASVDADSATASEIRSAGCGYVISPGDPQALAEAIQGLAEQRDTAKELGQAGRVWFEQTHAKAQVLKRYRDVLAGVCRGNA